ncbi:unnamed protein product [Orchesella dallaii]|uniref:Phospholipid scramblase n=1 Tax=Orchesella dallaii TaxID=48710 RepID=A0ABP1Q4W8_9HEXA
MAEKLKPLPTNKQPLPRSSLELETRPQKSVNPRSSNSTLVSHSTAGSRRSGDPIRRFLEVLDEFDSLYICPIAILLPPEIRKHVDQCVQRYEIKDYQGVTRFYAAETTHKSLHCLCSDARPFVIHMYDLAGNLLFECYRNCTGALCFCGVDCFSGGLTTGVNFGTRESYFGRVVTKSTLRSPAFQVLDETSDQRFVIKGPKYGKLLPCRLCGIHAFYICMPRTDISVGKIMYGYDGLSEELVPNPKTVGVIFPPRCSSEMKACLLAAGFMLV